MAWRSSRQVEHKKRRAKRNLRGLRGVRGSAPKIRAPLELVQIRTSESRGY
jgi:hypothetical protein